MNTRNYPQLRVGLFRNAARNVLPFALAVIALVLAACQDPASPADTTYPVEVRGLTGKAGNGQVVLTWTDPADSGLASIEITWNPGGTAPLAVPKGTQTKTVTGLTNGTAYTFTVKAVDTAGNKSAGVNTGPLTPNAEPPGFSSIEAVRDYLNNASGGKSADDPVSLRVNISIKNDFGALLAAIEKTDRYVALDLSVCDMTGVSPAGEFDPGTDNTGNNQIVSLILPNVATGIKAGIWAGNDVFSTFASFSGCAAFRGSILSPSVTMPSPTRP
jgi:hypothetical protein